MLIARTPVDIQPRAGRSRPDGQCRHGTFVLLALSCVIGTPVRADVIGTPVRADEVSGHWEGEVELPSIGSVQIMIDIARTEAGWGGTFHFPMQGVTDAPLVDVEVEDERVRFSVSGISGSPLFDGQLKGGRIIGTYSQFGASTTFWLGRKSLKPPARPQTPNGPFPYLAKEVEFHNANTRLAGTLTIPAGDGPFPAVVLISGSGSQDRDETFLGHKPFFVIADHLTRAGIAVLRTDDRGVGGSTGNIFDSTTSDFADDALCGIRFLQRHPKISRDRIGLLGHSEGGTAASLAASRSSDVAFVIMLAGAAAPLWEIFPRQIELIGFAEGTSKDKIDEEVSLWRGLFEIYQSDMKEEELDKETRRIIAMLVRLDADGKDAQDLKAAEEKELRLVQSQWFRFIARFEPRSAIRKVRVPVLALNGGLDLQVDAAQNLPRIEQALREANNDDVTVVRLPGLNHLFQKTETGKLSEYNSNEQTIWPPVLERLERWISVRFIDR